MAQAHRTLIMFPPGWNVLSNATVTAVANNSSPNKTNVRVYTYDTTQGQKKLWATPIISFSSTTLYSGADGDLTFSNVDVRIGAKSSEILLTIVDDDKYTATDTQTTSATITTSDNFDTTAKAISNSKVSLRVPSTRKEAGPGMLDSDFGLTFELTLGVPEGGKIKVNLNTSFSPNNGTNLPTTCTLGTALDDANGGDPITECSLESGSTYSVTGMREYDESMSVTFNFEALRPPTSVGGSSTINFLTGTTGIVSYCIAGSPDADEIEVYDVTDA